MAKNPVCGMDVDTASGLWVRLHLPLLGIPKAAAAVGLRPGQAQAGANLRFPGAHSEVIGGSDRLRIPFDKDVQTQHMLVWRHGTLDRHGQRHRAADFCRWALRSGSERASLQRPRHRRWR